MHWYWVSLWPWSCRDWACIWACRFATCWDWWWVNSRNCPSICVCFCINGCTWPIAESSRLMFTFTNPDKSTNLSRCCETNISLHASTTHASTKPWTLWDSAALSLLGRDIARGSAPPFRSPNWENSWHEDPSLITAAWLHLGHTPAITWGQPASPITYSPWTLCKFTIQAVESTATMVCTPTAWAPCVIPSNPQQASTSLKKSSQVCSEWNNTLVPSSTFSNGMENCCTRTTSNRVSTSGAPSKRPVRTIPVPARTERTKWRTCAGSKTTTMTTAKRQPPASTSARAMKVHGTTRWTERSTISRARPHLLVGVEPTAVWNHQPVMVESD